MKTITPLESQRSHQKKEVTLLDVRTPVEFSEKQIAGSHHIPLHQLEAEIATLEKEHPYILVCAGGKRAEKAYQLLSTKNFTNLQVMSNGIEGWEGANLSLKRSGSKTLPLMQQVQLAVGLGVFTFSLLAFFVNPAFAFGSAFFGAGLTLAGSTGWCGLGFLLSKMPWNNVQADCKPCSAST